MAVGATTMKRHLQKYKVYRGAIAVAGYLQYRLNFGRNRRVVSLTPGKPSQGNVLLSYYVSPFLRKPGRTVPHSDISYWHPNYWECLQMGRTFLDLGYAVDGIAWTDTTFVPRKDYAIFIDTRWNLQRLAPLFDKDCLKIMHIDVCHILFQNAAEANRLLALQQRKGVTLPPRRFERPNLAIEHADCATILGNEFTINTFRYANKPIYRVPISSTALHSWPEEKDFEACRNRFLWLGSRGLVRKGLDLVLDAFADMPEYHLTVCGPIEGEKDFQNAYYKELYQTPNIHTVGWVDTGSQEFIDVTNNCVGLVYPSCAEGQCGGVVTCLHAGLIPIISYESGVDVHDFGRILKNCSIEEIRGSIRKVSSLSAQELKLMARQAWEFARAYHTRARFAEEYRKVITQIMARPVSITPK